MNTETSTTNLPEINVIPEEEFEKQTARVFELLWKTLSKSFGPYGSQTIIYKHPFSHVTKDGFTIAHSLSMNVAETYTREAIMNMALQICGRMNNVVGDGTTTAIECTYSIYKNYLKNKEWLENSGILPRDLLKGFMEAKEMIREHLSESIRPIAGNDISKEQLKESIRQVVNISSNGDEVITDTISNLYGKLGYPAITCEKSKDGEERVQLVEGFRLKMYITDELYINNDEKTLRLDNADVLVFSCKITSDIYTNIIEPIWLLISRPAGRRLIVAAPSWDEILMDRKIAPELLREYKTNNGFVSLVVCAYKATNPYQKKDAEDFAMLCHTTIIDRAKATELIRLSQQPNSEEPESTEAEDVRFFDIINTRREYISHVPFPVIFTDMDGKFRTNFLPHKNVDPDEEISYIDTLKNTETMFVPGSRKDHPLYTDLGYVEDIDIGMEITVAHKFFYDENMYQLHLREADMNLEKIHEKYKRLGTFNLETTKAQQRVFALRLKMANIEVGGDSELSIGLRKDIYDDAIRAAESAFKHGVINGCNVSTIRTIRQLCTDMVLEESSDTRKIETMESIFYIIMNGFIDTYKTVLGNWIEDVVLIENLPIGSTFEVLDDKIDSIYEKVKDIYCRYIGTPDDDIDASIVDLFHDAHTSFAVKIPKVQVAKEYIKFLIWSTLRNSEFDKSKKTLNVTFFDLLIAYSINTDTVFDLTTKSFSNEIINSFQTDDEILNAVIDLLALLISGNQMVVTQRTSFEI